MKPEDCLSLEGLFTPVIDMQKCSGKGTCVTICPYNVFEMKAMDDRTYSSLSITGKLKTFIYGKEKGYVMNPDECRACGVCVNNCFEGAIKLEKINPGNTFSDS